MKIVKHRSIIKEDVQKKFNLKRTYGILFEQTKDKNASWLSKLIGNPNITLYKINIRDVYTEIQCLSEYLDEVRKIAEYLEKEYKHEVTIIIKNIM